MVLVFVCRKTIATFASVERSAGRPNKTIYLLCMVRLKLLHRLSTRVAARKAKRRFVDELNIAKKREPSRQVRFGDIGTYGCR